VTISLESLLDIVVTREAIPGGPTISSADCTGFAEVLTEFRFWYDPWRFRALGSDLEASRRPELRKKKVIFVFRKIECPKK
jgi:hypothetical protein